MWASLVAQLVKNLPAMQETLVWFLGQEDPLEESMATYSSILAWRIPMDRGAWWATVHGVTKSQTWLSNWAHSTIIYVPESLLDQTLGWIFGKEYQDDEITEQR